MNFCHEGLAAVLLDDIYTHVCRLNFLTKIAPVFAPAARRGAARNWLIEFVLPSPRLRILAFICMHCIQIYLFFVWKYCSVQPGRALVFCGNMCAVPLAWFSISPHIKVLYACPFSMSNLPFLWIWLLSYRKWLRPPFPSIWQSSNGFIMDFYWIIYGRFRIGMIMTEIFLSRWLNSPIEMIATSYWYEGMERGFFTLCYLSIWASFFLSLIQKIWRSSSQKESHLYKGYDRSFWAAKILSMG